MTPPPPRRGRSSAPSGVYGQNLLAPWKERAWSTSLLGTPPLETMGVGRERHRVPEHRAARWQLRVCLPVRPGPRRRAAQLQRVHAAGRRANPRCGPARQSIRRGRSLRLPSVLLSWLPPPPRDRGGHEGRAGAVGHPDRAAQWLTASTSGSTPAAPSLTASSSMRSAALPPPRRRQRRSEEHTSEL